MGDAAERQPLFYAVLAWLQIQACKSKSTLRLPRLMVLNAQYRVQSIEYGDSHIYYVSATVKVKVIMER
jgi:hypothetical protein